MEEKSQHEEKLNAQVAARVSKSTKATFKELTAAEGKEMSDVVREMVESYCDPLR